jgi:hypothetical protein
MLGLERVNDALYVFVSRLSLNNKKPITVSMYRADGRKI